MSVSPVTESLRVLVADDHPVVRAGVIAMVSADPRLAVVAQAADGAAAVEAWLQHRPCVALIDLKMPRLDGFGAIERIRHADPSAKLVVMTTLVGDEDVWRALHAGAHGFLLKDCEQTEMLDCVWAVAHGQRYLQPAAAIRLAERITRNELTDREQQVLDWLSQGLSNKRIAKHLDVAEGTVKTHVKNILSKLGASSRTQAARTAVQRGLVRSPAD